MPKGQCDIVGKNSTATAVIRTRSEVRAYQRVCRYGESRSAKRASLLDAACNPDIPQSTTRKRLSGNHLCVLCEDQSLQLRAHLDFIEYCKHPGVRQRGEGLGEVKKNNGRKAVGTDVPRQR